MTPETTIAAGTERQLVERIQQKGIKALHDGELDTLAEALDLQPLGTLHDSDWALAVKTIDNAASHGWDQWQQRIAEDAALKPLVLKATEQGLMSLHAAELDQLAEALHRQPLSTTHELQWTATHNTLAEAATKGWHHWQLKAAEAQPEQAVARS